MAVRRNRVQGRGGGPSASAPLGRLWGLMAFLTLGIGASPLSTASTIRILPLGDSITYGYSSPTTDPGGYRSQLFKDLTAAGFNPQFQGSSILNPDPTLPAASSPQEGHPGYIVDGVGAYSAIGISNHISTWLAPNNGVYPDYVLLMIGANNVIGNYHMLGAPYELGALVSEISALRPNAKILVSTLTPQTTAANEAEVQQFNKTISGPNGVIAQLQRLGKNVTLVDVGSALSASDISDLVHPTPGGYVKLGDAWFRAIVGNNITAAPEPSTLALLTLGMLGLTTVKVLRGRQSRE